MFCEMLEGGRIKKKRVYLSPLRQIGHLRTYPSDRIAMALADPNRATLTLTSRHCGKDKVFDRFLRHGTIELIIQCYEIVTSFFNMELMNTQKRYLQMSLRTES